MDCSIAQIFILAVSYKLMDGTVRYQMLDLLQYVNKILHKLILNHLTDAVLYSNIILESQTDKLTDVHVKHFLY